MGSIFISYRRSDSDGQALALYKDLVSAFGSKAVFMDVASLSKGLDYRVSINDRLQGCAVLLAVIGKDWLTATDDAGKRRLEQPHDLVRLEIAAALRRDIPVVPVLVREAKLPSEHELPDDLRDLVYRDGVGLSHTRWDSDTRELVDALRPYLKTSGAGRSSQAHSWKGVVGAATVVALLITAGITGLRGRDDPDTSASPVAASHAPASSSASAVAAMPSSSATSGTNAGVTRSPTVPVESKINVPTAPSQAAAQVARPKKEGYWRFRSGQQEYRVNFRVNENDSVRITSELLCTEERGCTRYFVCSVPIDTALCVKEGPKVFDARQEFPNIPEHAKLPIAFSIPGRILRDRTLDLYLCSSGDWADGCSIFMLVERSKGYAPPSDI